MKLILTQVQEVKLAYNHHHSIEPPVITTSAQAYEVLYHFFDEHMECHEAFRILLMDRRNACRGVLTVGQGGVTATTADPKIIFAAAVKSLACGIILAHNHPSGQLKPSEADIQLTRKLVAGGKLLDICVLDHIILTKTSFYSFADNGMM